MSVHLATLAIGLAVAWVFWLLFRELTSPLRKIPGPFAARLTPSMAPQLHRDLGPIVRIAPGVYSVDDADAVKTIYGFGSKFAKSDWYSAWQVPLPGSENLFSDQDVARHALKRKKFAFLYSMTSLVSYEPFVDECADLVCQRLREAAGRGEPVDMCEWMKYYAFDVITALTYGQRFGFLDKGCDVGGTISEVDGAIKYSTLVGVIPEIHRWIFRAAALIPAALASGFGLAGRLAIITFVEEQVEARKTSLETGIARVDVESRAPDTEDFMDRLLSGQGKQHSPEEMIRNAAEQGLTSIMAGFDSTALSLTAILYYLLKNPETLAKLREEVLGAASLDPARPGIVSLKTAMSMPYLQAVVKEGMRVHPGPMLPFFRTVPAGGAMIAGRFFPEGAVVGMSPWTAHFSKEVYGPDAAVFRPERWLEAEAAAAAGEKERLRRMDSSYMAWGLGTRSCVGKNIALLEMYKLLPRLVGEFDFRSEAPGSELKAGGHVWVKPEDFSVSVKVRG
ncbi:cytochrome P450 [Plectosphaerella cucumerina]|uniref:Cytochrome P450 n=1 Tax=Plectosphaerella cucumerina TaxID=40658 RepID=A0A8K0X4X0_9PEZI|nr:cytochrome P450 [Plectosphaerella cucumerina]